MPSLPALTANIAAEGRASSGYVHGPVALATAHASATGLHLCFVPAATRTGRIGEGNCLAHRWTIVLAGGSGIRLAQLTHAARGIPVPKQYCSLQGNQSLLAATLARADALVERKHVVTVVADEHEGYWRRELRDRARENVVVQPRNRGTAAGVLLPLLAIAARDPLAQVTLLPSDHFVADEPGFAAALRFAQTAAAHLPHRVLLIGIVPDAPESGYGWVLPGARRGPLRPVQRFIEKPEPAIASELLRGGAVWNSFVLVGSVLAFLRLYERRAPDLLAAFTAADAHRDPGRAAALYADLPEVDFCRALLEGSEPHLGLCIAPACGWTDLGTPARVAACMSWLAAHRAAEPLPGSLGAAALRGAKAPRQMPK